MGEAAESAALRTDAEVLMPVVVVVAVLRALPTPLGPVSRPVAAQRLAASIEPVAEARLMSAGGRSV